MYSSWWKRHKRPYMQKECQAAQTDWFLGVKNRKGKWQETQDCKQAKQMCEDFLNCLRTAFIPIPVHCDCLPQAHRPGDWWASAGVDSTPEGSFREGLWWQLVLQHENEEDFHTAGLAPEVCSFDLSISPQRHHFSNPKDQDKEYLQSASCSAFVCICICCKRKTHLQWKSKEMSLFLPYDVSIGSQDRLEERRHSIEAMLVFTRLIQLLQKTRADYHWLQRKLSQTPWRIWSQCLSKVCYFMSLITSPASRSAPSTGFFLFFFSSTFPILLNSTYWNAQLAWDVYLHDIYLHKLLQAI